MTHITSKEARAVADVYKTLVSEEALKPHVDGAGNVHLPPGKYYIGDPCYVVPQDKWQEVGASNDWFESSPLGSWTKADGSKGYAVGLGTAYGDGHYHSNTVHSFGVDAGLIGCVNMNDVDGDADRITNQRLGAVVEFPKGLIVYAQPGENDKGWSGALKVNNPSEIVFEGENDTGRNPIIVYTNPDSEEDEEESEEEPEEEPEEEDEDR